MRRKTSAKGGCIVVHDVLHFLLFLSFWFGSPPLEFPMAYFLEVSHSWICKFVGFYNPNEVGNEEVKVYRVRSIASSVLALAF